jgi:N-glycosylase/DNA lyase
MTVRLHAWSHLAPLSLDDDGNLNWVCRLPVAGVRVVHVRWNDRSLTVTATVDGVDLDESDCNFIRERLRWMFRADEDFTPFWALCRKSAGHRWCAESKAGALLRSASVFEDLIKTLCTVNCTWSKTIGMTGAICSMFGDSAAGTPDRFCFPTPERLARVRESQLRKTGLGFRAPWIQILARRVVSGELELERLRHETDPDSLRDKVQSIRGVGPYSAHHMLMLFGHYRFIPCDSEVCSFLGLPSSTSQATVQEMMDRRYRRWGEYAYLGFRFRRVAKKMT